jgi:hypothetical protein
MTATGIVLSSHGMYPTAETSEAAFQHLNTPEDADADKG